MNAYVQCSTEAIYAARAYSRLLRMPIMEKSLLRDVWQRSPLAKIFALQRKRCCTSKHTASFFHVLKTLLASIQRADPPHVCYALWKHVTYEHFMLPFLPFHIGLYNRVFLQFVVLVIGSNLIWAPDILLTKFLACHEVKKFPPSQNRNSVLAT